MHKSKKKLVAIVGPTASGKSDLGIYLAKKMDGEIVSVDSRQVYRGMDIGTGKVQGKLDKNWKLEIACPEQGRRRNWKLNPLISEDVPHWLIDIIDPKYDKFSVAEFQDLAYQLIFDTFRRGKLPILVGGSMLYMDAVLEGYQIPKTSLSLRRELEKFSTSELLNQLRESDSKTYKKIDHQNRRRILRALESYLLNQRSLHEYNKKKPNFKYLILGVNWLRTELYQRIDQRVDKRIKQGMIEEVEGLIKKGVSYKKLNDFGLEYRYISQYIKKIRNSKFEILNKSKTQNPKYQNNAAVEKDKQEMIQILKFKIHAFARRQLVWWRRNKKIRWINFEKKKDKGEMYKKLEKLVTNFLTDYK